MSVFTWAGPAGGKENLSKAHQFLCRNVSYDRIKKTNTHTWCFSFFTNKKVTDIWIWNPELGWGKSMEKAEVIQSISEKRSYFIFHTWN